MGTIVAIVMLVWLVGVIIARLQLAYWKEKGELSDKCDINILSLLSWIVYVIYTLAWIYDKEHEEE